MLSIAKLYFGASLPIMYEFAFYFARVGILLKLVMMIISREDWRVLFFQASFHLWKLLWQIWQTGGLNSSNFPLEAQGCKSGVSRLQSGVSRLQTSVLPGLPPGLADATFCWAPMTALPCACVSAVSVDTLSFHTRQIRGHSHCCNRLHLWGH